MENKFLIQLNRLIKSKRANFTLIVTCILFIKILYSDWLMGGVSSLGALSTSIGFLTLLLSISFIFKQRNRKIYLLTINILISLLLVSDLLYFKYFRSPLTLHVFFQVNNLSGLGPSVMSMVDFRHVLLFIDLLFLPLLIRMNSWKTGKNLHLFISLFVVGILLLSLKPIKNLFIDNVDNFQKDDALSYVRNWGPLGHHVLDTFYFMKDGQDIVLSHNQRKHINDWFIKKNNIAKENKKNSPYYAWAQGKNLIMIQVESLQNFVINRKENGQEITPTLNRLLENSLYFPHFYPQTVEGNSSDAELLSNTSLYPIQQGSTFFRFPYNTYLSLGQMLKEKGYSTFAVHGDEGDFWNRDEAYPQLGFDEYIDIDYFDFDEEIGMGLSDGSMFRQSISMLKEKKSPFYAFYITLTSHIPFEIPEPLKGLKLPDEMNHSLIGNYYQSIHYTDRVIGEFLQELTESGILENSLVVLYGDHDGIHKKDILEVEEWITGKEITDKVWIENFLQVPLIIYNPTLKREKINTIGGQIDIMPTLAYLLGINESKYQNYVMGQNLLTTHKGYAIIPSGDYSERAYVTEDKTQTFLDKEQQQLLDYADQIIRSNYFKQIKK